MTLTIQDVNENVNTGKLYVPLLMWIAWNMILVSIGSFLVSFVEPVARGSGIPQVKCYLNGIKINKVVRINSLFVKAVGVITSVVGGLAGGKVRRKTFFHYIC